MSKTIFSRIIDGELPSHKIFEDELTYAFLDINPLSEGHTLVVPKQPVDHLDDCPPDLYQAVFATVHKISAHLRDVLKPKRVGLIVQGFEVPHAHVLVVPLYTGSEIPLDAVRGQYQPDQDELAEVAAKIRLSD